MAEAAEIFRREMDAMRDELQGPKVDPVSVAAMSKLPCAGKT